MNSDIPKHLMSVGGDTVIRHTVRAFEKSERVDSIVVVCGEGEIREISSQLAEFKKVVSVVAGGKCRMESARLGFAAIPDEADMIAVHDAARCLILSEDIERVISEAEAYGAATAGTAVVDTVKYAECGMIRKTVSRENLFLAHTPQIFDRVLYKKALDSAEDVSKFTDDNSLIEALGEKVRCVDTGRKNIKLTTRDDLLYAEFLLSKRGGK